MSIIANEALCQEISSSGAQSPSVGYMQNGTINYGTINNRFGDIRNYHITAPRSSKLNSLDKKREALLMAENPTVLEVVDLKWTTWFGDHQPFLTILLLNKSKLPALDVRVQMMRNRSAQTFAKLKPYDFPKSYILKGLDGQKINVAGAGAWSWPLAGLDEVAKIVSGNCITGAGFDYATRALDFSKPVSSFSVSSHNTGFYLKISYETIFQEKISYFKAIVIDSAERPISSVSETENTESAQLLCIGDKH